MIGAVAEFYRRMIRQRQAEGIANARANKSILAEWPQLTKTKLIKFLFEYKSAS